MKLFKLSLLICFLICACTSKGLTPSEAAQQTCTCMKLSKDISEEGVKAFTDCISPSSHSAFKNVKELLDFIELLYHV